ncbi:pirin family protein [Rhodoferax sp. U11-2br]|uniref:pirin family protein n=1 Tax=Rhodoferax sp. U11-2br TaxID=2838878 RepID=UPI001BE95C2D|nr:pirin family protein [Rhodoferax sp. U11-2br]MBT3068564.1 pirin family protein [Rhodoferax sp. U11-2br]
MSAPQLLGAHAHDLGGGFVVRRLLPAAQRQAVGPFLFFDHFGPVTVTPADNHDVRPHPHIGLATLTYLFDGVIQHRDNLGYVQRIEPGAINWMTAGSGIVHSERKPEAERHSTYVNHGLQLWLALPESKQEVSASFVHTPASAIPELQDGCAQVRVLVGQALGAQSPVATLSPTLYLDIRLPAHGQWTLPMLADEQAVYGVQGDLQLDGQPLPTHTLAVLSESTVLSAGPDGARLMLVGGQPLGRRFIWWNFVSTSRERIEQASRAWAAMDPSQGMGQVPGETEYIPLPQREPSRTTGGQP